MKSLKTLLQIWQTAVTQTDLPQPPHYAGPDIQIANLVEHTGKVERNSCFIARVRNTSDGHPFIPQAIASGATLILGQRHPDQLPEPIPNHVTYLQVADTAETLAYLAAAWHDFPSKHLTMIGITGTDGKTSVINILYEVMRAHGLKTGMITTINAVLGEQAVSTGLHVTTPSAPDVQRYLRQMVDAGLTHCILETTSHGLAQYRVDAIDFDIATVTNITHEHLDYHGSYEAYFAAKVRLFNMVARKPHGRFILNRDDASYTKLKEIAPELVHDYAIYQPAEVTANDIQYTASTTHFKLNLPTQTVSINSQLVGEFNVHNMLAAALIGTELGITPDSIQRGLETISQISGRMQRINEGQEFLVLVDFAHTPFSLEKALKSARTMLNGSDGRVIALFGSAGKRDVVKRRMMAEISAQHADLTVLTAEDPRNESLDDILEMMAEGCRAYNGIENETFWRIHDRGQAIYFALSLAKPGDIVMVCGKGHEQSMCFGTTEYPWDDRDATRAALQAFLTNTSMPNLGLPTFLQPN